MSYATSIGLLSVTVINILVTLFIVNRRDQQVSDGEVVGSDEESPRHDGGSLETDDKLQGPKLALTTQTRAMASLQG